MDIAKYFHIAIILADEVHMTNQYVMPAHVILN